MARLLPLILLTLLLVPAAARADDFTPTVESCTSQLAGKGCVVVGNQYSGVTDVAVSPDGRFAYVAALTGDALFVMDRNPATGALSFKSCVSKSATAPCAPGRAMDGPSDVEVSPDGSEVVVATRFAGLAVFDRNATTGGLTQRLGQQGCVERQFQTEGCLPVNGIDVGEGTLSVRFGPGADPTDVYLGSPNGAILNLERVPGTGVLSQLAGSIGCARRRQHVLPEHGRHGHRRDPPVRGESGRPPRVRAVVADGVGRGDPRPQPGDGHADPGPGRQGLHHRDRQSDRRREAVPDGRPARGQPGVPFDLRRRGAGLRGPRAIG